MTEEDRGEAERLTLAHGDKFKIWVKAYTRKYANSRLVDGEFFAEQAWGASQRALDEVHEHDLKVERARAAKLIQAIKDATDNWGVDCILAEIKDAIDEYEASK